MTLRRLKYLLRFRREGRELSEEIDFHRAQLEEQQRALGLSAEDARDAAESLMGNMALAKTEARRVWLLGLARRGLLAFAAAVAVLLGIAANTILRPWPVQEANRVVSFGTTYDGVFSGAEYQYVGAHSRALSGIALENGNPIAIDGRGPAYAHFVSGNYFDVVRVKMAMGRGFTAEDGRPDTSVAVIGYNVWRVQYGGDPGILGRSIELNGFPVRVIGVAGKGFTGTNGRADVWAPLVSMPLIQPDAGARLTGSTPCCYVTARLAPGVTRKEGQAEINRLSAQFRTQTRNRRRPRTVRFEDAKPRNMFSALTGS